MLYQPLYLTDIIDTSLYDHVVVTSNSSDFLQSIREIHLQGHSDVPKHS